MSETASDKGRGFSGKQVVLFVLLAIVVTAGLTFWYVRTYVFPSAFTPISLSTKEQSKLDEKLLALGLDPIEILPNAKHRSNEDRFDDEGRLIAERYTEDASRLNINLSEKELNAMVASNPELARRFAINLSDNLASAKLLIPVDPDFPVFAGQTLRVTAGLEFDYQNAEPVVILRGVSVMGVPIPNAWLGNLKNVDLVQEFGVNPGFWRSFSAGIESIAIEDGGLQIALKE